MYTVLFTLSNYIKIRSKSFMRKLFEILYPWRVEKEIELVKAITLLKHVRILKKFQGIRRFHLLYEIVKKIHGSGGGKSPLIRTAHCS